MSDVERVLYFAAALVAAFVVSFQVGRVAAPTDHPAPGPSPTGHVGDHAQDPHR